MRHACLLLLPLVACNNYDFAKARKADGELDLPKLIADLKASGDEQLTEGTWIPLLWLDLTTFGPSKPNYPKGYTLQEVASAGPIFCAGKHTVRYVDEQAAPIEREDRRWLGWGVLYHDHEGRVVTPSGTRVDDSHRLALIFGDDSTNYVTARPAESEAGR